MIDCIYQIGQFTQQKYPELATDYEDLSDNGRYKHLFVIRLTQKNGDIAIASDRPIDYEQITADKNPKYLYKAGSPRGLDYTPCSKITSIEKTFDIKIYSYFKKYASEYPLLAKIESCLKENKDRLVQSLTEKKASVTDKAGCALTLKLNNAYLGEQEEVSQIFDDLISREFFEKYGTQSLAEQQMCSVSKKITQVCGFVNTYNFYTANELGMVSGGFKQENAWKNYPVSIEVGRTLQAGRNYINRHLNFSFYGFRYLMLPRIIINNSKLAQEVFEILHRLSKEIRLSNKTERGLIRSESQILREVAKQKNYTSYSLLFYDAPKGLNGAVFNILTNIEDVYPSRLRRIFEQVHEINDRTYIDLLPEDEKRVVDEKFNLGVIRRRLYPYESKNQQNIKPFLGLVKYLFKDQKISYRKIITDMMFRIGKAFKQGYNFEAMTIELYALLELLFELDMFNDYVEKQGGSMSNVKSAKTALYERYIQENNRFFSSDAKKATFLVGVLVKELLREQFKRYKNTPFQKKLKGLNISRDLLASLFREAVNKLEEYKRNYYVDLESLIADYFVRAGDQGFENEKEISFVFTLGMALQRMFRDEEEKENPQKE